MLFSFSLMQQVLELFGSRKFDPKSAAFARSTLSFSLFKKIFLFFHGFKILFHISCAAHTLVK